MNLWPDVEKARRSTWALAGGFAQVLGCLEQTGHAAVVERLERALREDEPLLLALQKPRATAASSMALPSSLNGSEVLAGRAADYDALLGGAS
jgi:hypothetical protein